LSVQHSRLVDYARCYQLGLILMIIVIIPTVSLRLLQVESLAINIGIGSVSCLIAYLMGFFLLKQNSK